MQALRNYWEFEQALQQATAGMARLRAEFPADSFLDSIQRQLGFAAEWTQGGKRPGRDDVRKLSFAAMASKAVDELDPGLAEILYQLSCYLNHWPEKP